VTKGFTIAAALAAALTFTACGGGGSDRSSSSTSSGGGGANTVVLKNITFSPSKLTVKPGTTVQWVWKEAVAHNVHGDTFKSELKSKGSFEHTFDQAGDYPYKCDVHPAMTGTITVAPA
jgi:plastocyanin